MKKHAQVSKKHAQVSKKHAQVSKKHAQVSVSSGQLRWFGTLGGAGMRREALCYRLCRK
ncbi:hypothetical protein [Paenibacillus macerans]|uniref:hypothetical protein n=1 Tax=Paenibacillus macerans TaxID=44252 RepID=UPI000B0BFA0D|nr:hypothetical protein [Paenibacillus macerans]MCY7559031.1 hypothetical protein [Paenibacillus macerans]MEC0152727.1 hypothetical protein [Paenibacillus macerans]